MVPGTQPSEYVTADATRPRPPAALLPTLAVYFYSFVSSPRPSAGTAAGGRDDAIRFPER